MAPAFAALSSSEFPDLIDLLPGVELQLDVLRVELTALREAGANRSDALDGAPEFEAFDSNRGHGALPGREDGPHVRAQCVHRPLEILQPRRERWGTRKSRVDVVKQTAVRGQLLGE
jgi:hypothetical protein